MGSSDQMKVRGAYMAITAGLVAAIALPAGASERRAQIALADRDPVIVVGHGLLPRERVSVRVSPAGGTPYRKVVRARATGTFRAVFADHSLDECAAYAITAVGTRSSRIAHKRIDPPPPCGIVIIP